jgi:uncharacterized phage protein (TIGR01671 family)
MRDIKFRIWSKVRRQFVTEKTELIKVSEVEERLLRFGDYYLSLNGKIRFLNYDSLDQEPNKDSNYILEQYTGCLDKNHKEIYEGDILASRGNYITDEYDENGNYKDLINVVVWNTEMSRFGLIPLEKYPFYKDGPHDGIWACRITTFKEVIGNIHEGH